MSHNLCPAQSNQNQPYDHIIGPEASVQCELWRTSSYYSLDTNEGITYASVGGDATTPEEASGSAESTYSDLAIEDSPKKPSIDTDDEIRSGEVSVEKECHVGWYRRDDNNECDDINECTDRPCHHSRANCINKQGDFHCECFKTYVGDGFSCYIGLNMLIIPPDKHLHSSVPGIATAYKLTLRWVFKFLLRRSKSDLLKYKSLIRLD